MVKIIGISGFIGSGKDTAAQILISEFGYEKISWAMTLKDITAALFDWDRDMIEGLTKETREQREEIDNWWSSKLGVEWSPRIALQKIGTEIMRDNLNADIWVLSVLKKIEKKDKVVISDTRFSNEMAYIKKMGGEVWRINRGNNPSWVQDLTAWKETHPYFSDDSVRKYMAIHHPKVHVSEFGSHGCNYSHIVDNNGSIDELRDKIKLIVKD